MTEAVAAFLVVPILTLLSIILVPTRWANTKPLLIRRGITAVAGLQFLVASVLGIAFLIGQVPLTHATLISFGENSPLGLTIRYDGVSGLMLALVSFVGWVICRYSIRYLDGEATQGRYFRWTSFTIGAVSLMVVSGNLLLFIAAWVMTSTGLHHLLLHYPERPAAQRAAWTKFSISRIGDAGLVAALALIYSQYQTFDFAELFAAIQLQAGPPSWETTLAGWCLVVGAVTKSAQLPFHTWLPLTMETPTPVSALMHAGIVNAGGYLIIRTSPMLSLVPTAMTSLAILGGATACFAAVVMLTQTSVKKSLAYSTIAQMGFMMLQCGLGAFSAAMLHIIAHSLYKAHAFLNSGSVLTQAAAVEGPKVEAETQAVGYGKLLGIAAVVVSFYAIALAVFGVTPTSKPGGVLLGSILCLALISWLAQVLKTQNRQVATACLSIAGLLCIAYAACFVAVDSIVSPALPAVSAPAFTWLIAAVVAIGFAAMFVLQRILPTASRPAWIDACYVHASNGFYVDAWLRRMLATLASE